MKVTVSVRKTTNKEKVEAIVGLTLIIGIIYFIQHKRQG